MPPVLDSLTAYGSRGEASKQVRYTGSRQDQTGQPFSDLWTKNRSVMWSALTSHMHFVTHFELCTQDYQASQEDRPNKSGCLSSSSILIMVRLVHCTCHVSKCGMMIFNHLCVRTCTCREVPNTLNTLSMCGHPPAAGGVTLDTGRETQLLLSRYLELSLGSCGTSQHS